MMRQRIMLTSVTMAVTMAAATLLPACAHVKVDPIEVKPIHIVQDINITLKVDQELDQFFAFQEGPAGAAASQSTTQATSTQTAATQNAETQNAETQNAKPQADATPAATTPTVSTPTTPPPPQSPSAGAKVQGVTP
jgi:hypothetical protein